MLTRLIRVGVAALTLICGEAAYAETPEPVPSIATIGQQDFDALIVAAKSAMMADPDVALERAREAANAAKGGSEEGRTIRMATAQWLQAEALIRLNHPREAEPILKEALGVVQQAQPGSKLYGDLLMTRASLAGVVGDVTAALQTYQEAHNVYQAIGENRGRAIALQNIGSIYSDARDYQRVLQYYAQSAEAYSGDPALNISTHNNRGFAYLDLGQYAEAEAEFTSALHLAQEQNSQVLEVRILTNVALAQLGAKKLGEADATAMQALEIAKEAAEGWEPFLWGVRAKVAFAERNLPAAATFIDRTFAAADLDATTMPFKDFHEAASEIYEANGNPTAALDHLKAFKRLDDEARNVAASINSALASAQFDFANQELNITKLKAGQLDRDLALAAWNSRFLYSLLGAAAVLLAVMLGAFLWIRRSRDAVRRANAKLSSVNSDLERALQARTRFLAMTSHELRTPLNGVLGMTEVILADRSLGEQVRGYVQQAYNSGQVMKTLVDDILDVAKIEAGHLELDDRIFDLKPVLHGVVNLWRLEAMERQISLNADLSQCPTLVHGDEQRIRQIVYNLMSNAMKFTARGEITVTASTEARDGTDRLILKVADTGIGIPADKLEVIFESFQQVDASVSRQFGGTGLGLAICRSLASAMNGTISVESVLGSGSTFTVDIALPMTTERRIEVRHEIDRSHANDLLIVIANPLTHAVLRNKLQGSYHAIHARESWSASDGSPCGFGQIVLESDAVGGSAAGLAEALTDIRSQNAQSDILVLLPERATGELVMVAERLANCVLMRPVSAKSLVAELETRRPFTIEPAYSRAVA